MADNKPGRVFRGPGVLACLLALVLAGAGGALAGTANPPGEATWTSISGDLFGDADIADGAHLMTLEAPYRAHDAALVPITFTARPGVKFESVSIVIDENPAPLAATFTFGPAAAEHSFSTRFRVNSYSYVRAVAKAEDGRFYMVKRFVKASGGCSAPASKDVDVVLAEMGRMKFRRFESEGASGPAVAEMSPAGQQGQVMIRHPNFSGLQMDQVTMHYIPARFLDRIEILQGEQLIIRVEGGISLSEDPNIRFYFRPDAKGSIAVRAGDTEGTEFSRVWPLATGS